MPGTDADTLDLGRLALSPGEARTVELPVRPGALELGGQLYAARPEAPEVRVDVSRTLSGYALRVRLSVRLEGPCMRCLDPAGVELEVDAREVDQPGSGDEELRSPYVDEGKLDLEGWVHDAVILALPPQLLCRPDCAGLCSVCGVSLNDADPAEHRHGGGLDPRFAKLRELGGE